LVPSGYWSKNLGVRRVIHFIYDEGLVVWSNLVQNYRRLLSNMVTLDASGLDKKYSSSQSF
jgi:hypothetical protein